jgi:PAS domain S-box-containing protein
MKTPTVHPWADQEQLEAIFGTFGEGLIVLDLEGNILYMNPAALGMRRLRELWQSKKNVRDFIGAFDLYDQKGAPIPMGEWPLARVLEGRTYENLEVREQDSRTAEVRVMSYSSSLLHRDGEAALGIVTVRDITERKLAEERLEQRARQQSAVAELGLEALHSDDVEALMNEATRRLAEALHVEYCKVLELLPDGDALLLKAGVGWKEGYVGQATVGTEKSSQAGYTLRSMNPVIVRDLREEERFSGPALLHEHGVVSGLSVIIYAGKQPYGVLGAHTTQKRGFSDDDVNVLQAVANLLGEVIVRQRLLDALRENESYFRRLFEDNPYPMWVYDLNTLTFLEVNTAAVKHYGYTRNEFLGMRMFDPEPERIATVTVRIEGTAFQVGASRPLAVRRGDPRELEIRPGGPPMEIIVVVPAGTAGFTLRAGGTSALVVDGERITVLCSPSTRQWLSNGRGWVTFSPVGGRLDCGPPVDIRPRG